MKDLIDRKAVLKIINDELEYSDNIYATSVCITIRRAVNDLPSAQPDIIRCKDCKHYYFADNRIPQEQRYSCALDGDRWKPDSFCSFAERRIDG